MLRWDVAEVAVVTLLLVTGGTFEVVDLDEAKDFRLY
jgi:hypothetical protein